MNQNQVNLEPEEPLLPSPSSEMLAYMEKLYPLIFAFKQTKLWKSGIGAWTSRSHANSSASRPIFFSVQEAVSLARPHGET